MINKVVVVLRSGQEITLVEWQKIYGLQIGSDSVGKYFSLRDHKLRQDLEDYDKLVVNELLIRVLDAFRENLKKPVVINSFNRSEAKQLDLEKRGFKTAKVSPHVVFMAADLNCTSPEMVRDFVKRLRIVSKNLGIKIRIGSEEYLRIGMTFVHVDVCPEYFGVGKPFNKKQHPQPWEVVVEW